MQKPSENPINLRIIQKKAYENQKKTSEKTGKPSEKTEEFRKNRKSSDKRKKRLPEREVFCILKNHSFTSTLFALKLISPRFS